MARNRTKKQYGGAHPHDLEVKSKGDLSKLDAIMKEKPVIIVFYVGAEEWCGPCKRYRPVWDEYKNTPGRKLPMIHVDHKMVPDTVLAKAKIDGFPTNGVYSAADGSFAPIADIHNKRAMKTLLKTDPTKVMRATNNDNTEEAEQTPTAHRALIESGKKAVKNINSPLKDMNDPTPPNISADTLERNSPIEEPKIPAKGGSLFESMLRFSKGLGRPTRRAKKGKRTRKAI